MVKLRNFNFRQSRSERAGENAYRNFRPNFFGKFKIKNLKSRGK